MRLKSIFMVCTCALLAGLSLKVMPRTVEYFFLDWKQILAETKPPANPFRILDVSDLRNNKDHSGYLDAKTLLRVLENVSAVKPKAIILALDPSILGPDIPPSELAEKLSKTPNLFLFVDTNIFKGLSFDEYDYPKTPSYLWLTPTYESQYDRISRRIIVYYDLKQERVSKDFETVKSLTGTVRPPDHFNDDFTYVGTKQVYMKIWPNYKFGEVRLQTANFSKTILQEFSNEVVIVGTSGIFALNSVPSINQHLDFSNDQKMDLNYWPASYLIATYMTNLYSGEYVKQPTLFWNWFWIFCWMIILYISLLFAQVTKSFWISSVVLLVYVVAGLLVFRFWSFNFDTGRGLIIGVVSQYFVLSIRYVVYIRQSDRDKFQKQQAIVEEKIRSRMLVRVVATESTLRTIGQVSHDIRSPLMALQVANSLIKDQVSSELRELLENATSRIRGISEDLFSKYKEKESNKKISETNLKKSIEDLIHSYEQVHPRVKFIVEISTDLYVQWPYLSIQRSFANLLTNSIEACNAIRVQPVIEIKATSDETNIYIEVKDNGPGVPQEALNKLFSEGGTFGKDSGTGLGLFQVRKDLELIGGTISYDFAYGARFRIKFPRGIEQIKFYVSKKVILIENSENTSALQRKLKASGVDVAFFTAAKEAMDFIKEIQNPNETTLICDLMLSQHEETGFDILDFVEGLAFYKKILCTSLADNEEITSLASRKEALLINKFFLESVDISQKL